MSLPDTDLRGEILVIRASAHAPEYRDLAYRLFRAEGGSGCDPHAGGTAVIGRYLIDGEHCAWGRGVFEHVATPEDMQALPPEKRLLS